MSNIKIYDWTSDTGELESRSIIVEEFEENGKQYCNIMKQIDFNDFEIEYATTIRDNEILKFVEGKRWDKKEKDKNYELVPMDEEAAKRIRQEQKSNFRIINESLEEKLDLDRVDELIDNVQLFEKIDKEQDQNTTGTLGFYSKDENLIALNTNMISNDEEDGKVTRFHEFIHLIQSLDKPFNFDYLNEPQVQALAEERFLEKINDYIKIPVSKKYKVNKDGKNIMIGYNFNFEGSYMCLESYLKQMEVALEREFYKKNLTNRIGFYKDFADRYGAPLLTYMAGRMRKSEYGKFKDLDERATYISESQDVLFKEVFDKDIDSIGSIEGAINVLNKMKEMGKYRQIIHVFSENHVKHYDNYKNLYDEYYRKIGRKLAYMGHPKEDIISKLEEHSYKDIYGIGITDLSVFKTLINKNIKGFELSRKTKYDVSKTGTQYIIGNYGQIITRMYNKEDNRTLYMCMDRSSNDDELLAKYNIQNEFSMPELDKSNFKPLFDSGKKFTEIDVDKYIEREAEQEERE